MKLKTLALVGLSLSLFGCPDGGGGATDPTDPTADTAPTGDTDTQEPPPADPTFTVTLEDGDGQADDPTMPDDDTLTVEITNPPEGDWFFGYAQTMVGEPNGWFGEDCFSGDVCHPIPAPVDVDGTPTSTLTLTRVASANAIVAGSTMLLPVDFPVESTPDCTFYIGQQTNPDTCYVFGHDPSYYGSLNCMDPGPAASTNQ